MSDSGFSPGRRLPFNFVDEAFANTADADAPPSIEIEVEVAGRLDEQRLRDAIDAAVRIHPLAGAKQAPAGALDRGYEWEIVGRCEVDPLRVVECPDDNLLREIRDAFQSSLVPVDQSPPFRVLLVHGRERDVLMLNVSHVAADGLGSVHLLRSILRACDGEQDRSEVRNFPALRSFERLYARPFSPEWLVRLPWIQRAQLDAASGSPARIASDGGEPRAGYGIEHLSLPLSDFRQVQARTDGATINDLLLAALTLTIDRWNRDHGLQEDRIVVLLPINLRPSRDGGGFSNLSLSTTVASLPEDRRSPLRLIRRIRDQTRRIKEQPEAAVMIDVYRPAGLLPNAWKRSLPSLFAMATGHRFTPTVLLSNLGRIEPGPGLGQLPGPLWFSPPCRMPLGVSVGAVSVGESLHLSFRLHRRQLSAVAVTSFLAQFSASLATLDC